jgi:nitroreductase
MIAGGAGAAVLAALGYRAWDRGVFSFGEGPAFAPWTEWQGRAGEGIVRPLHAAILAANPHDTQPWLFAPHGDSITVYADRARNLGTFDPFRREMHLGLGCAIANLQLAAYMMGFFSHSEPSKGQLDLSPSDAPVAVSRVILRRKNAPETDAFSVGTMTVQELAQAIPRRHTNRGPYLARRVPSEFLDGWKRWETRSPTRIVFMDDIAARKELTNIIVEATAAIIADPEMSADSARWFRTGAREIAAHRDGVITDTAGLSPIMRVAAKLMPDQDAATADRYWLSMTRDVQTATAPVFGMILVRDRLDMATALEAGSTWQSLHLAATARGLAAQPMNQPVEMVDRNAMLGRKDHFGPALAKLADMPGWEATFVFRLGYAEREALPSPRRPLSDVMIRRA